MEQQDIISSGLLELYAMGLASESESRQVEQWVAKYPEIASELQAIESTLEIYARANAVQPDPHVKQKLLSKINGQDSAKVIPLKSTGPVSRPTTTPPYWKFAAAASVVLLLLSAVANVLLYNRYNEAHQKLTSAENNLAVLQESNKAMEQDMGVVQSKYSVPVSLNGLPAAPEAAAKIFWMKNTGEVYVDPSNLPETPEGKRYQLWGIVDGKPVNGGMILYSKKGDKYHIQKMKAFGNVKVDAFAITLEAEMDSPVPKGPMYVMGKM